MFKFLFKKSISSVILIVLIVITSIFLFDEFRPYFQYFPITNNEELMKMANTGGSSDFVKALYTYDDETKLTIIRDYYSKILENDDSLSLGERNIIENKILKSQTIDEFYQAYTDLFYYAIDIGTDAKHEAYFNKLERLSGEDYSDVNKRIENSLEKHRISYYFAMRYADRLMIIWSLSLFVFITFRFSVLNNKKVKYLIYPKSFKSYSYILNNIAVEFLIVLIVTSVQMFSFAFLFNWHLKGTYVTSIYDYVQVYLLFVVPSLLIIIGFINFLYYLFDSPFVAFPIYYIVESLSSKISPELGYTINKTNLIIRYDTLFEPLTAVEYNDLIINRIIMISMFIILLPVMFYILDKKRVGMFNFKLSIRGIKNEQKC
ncbi:hypothetical protein [Caloranaerobacter sp. DY30410]|uniref:hypothetical protein n=1 Tax=Caloranaerobacter sp. DY30410 TaxID=3238305 RepID=UPI003D07E78B